MATTFSDIGYKHLAFLYPTKLEFWQKMLFDAEFGLGQRGDAMVSVFEEFMPEDSDAFESFEDGKIIVYGSMNRRNWANGHTVTVTEQFEMDTESAKTAEGIEAFDESMQKMVDRLTEAVNRQYKILNGE